MRLSYPNAILSLALMLCAIPARADVTGYAKDAADLLAGPGTVFPALARIDSGAKLGIVGCVEGYSWCDVTWNGNRGWMAAGNLDSLFHDRRVSVSRYGLQADVPTLEFEQKSYWERNYRSRPFFGEQRYWSFFP
jgi:uncharacterized protein YraI